MPVCPEGAAVPVHRRVLSSVAVVLLTANERTASQFPYLDEVSSAQEMDQPSAYAREPAQLAAEPRALGNAPSPPRSPPSPAGPLPSIWVITVTVRSVVSKQTGPFPFATRPAPLQCLCLFPSQPWFPPPTNGDNDNDDQVHG